MYLSDRNINNTLRKYKIDNQKKKYFMQKLLCASKLLCKTGCLYCDVGIELFQLVLHFGTAILFSLGSYKNNIYLEFYILHKQHRHTQYQYMVGSICSIYMLVGSKKKLQTISFFVLVAVQISTSYARTKNKTRASHFSIKV